MYPDGKYCYFAFVAMLANWLKDFKTFYKIAESISAFGLLICVFLLVSFAFLPVDKTRRHWLSLCLLVGIVMEAVSAFRNYDNGPIMVTNLN